MTWEQWWYSMPQALRDSYGPQGIVASKHAWDEAQAQLRKQLEAEIDSLLRSDHG